MRRVSIFWPAVVLCALLFPPSLGAQLRFERSVVIDREKGLPTNDVRAICQDADGFIWFATTDGLCRFDGTRFRYYRSDPDDPYALLDDHVTAVVSFHGRIWTGTAKGISVLDPKTHTFEHVRLDTVLSDDRHQRIPSRQVSHLYVDRHGDLWAGTYSSGVARYRLEHRDFEFFQVSDSINYGVFATGSDLRRILSFAASATNDSVLYAGTPTGLQEINRYTGAVRLHLFPQPTPQLQVAANAFLQLHAHDNGLLYTGSWRAGVHVFDPVQQTFRPLPLRPGPANDILQSPTRRIARKNGNELWISSIKGLVVYDIRREAVVFWRRNNLRDGLYFGIDFVDNSNRAWHANINGVHLFDPCLQQFVPYDYQDLRPPGWTYAFYIAPAPDAHEMLILPRYDNGIYHFDLNRRAYARHRLKVPGAPALDTWETRGLSRAPDGSYTICAEHGFFSYSAQTSALRPLDYRPPVEQFNVNHIHWDRRGCLWMSAGRKGLFCWNPRSGQTRAWQQALVPPATEPNPVVYFVAEDSRGQIWIRRDDGFSVYLPERDTLYNFVHSTTPERSFTLANAFAEDGQGRLWIAGRDGWIGYAEVARPERGIVRKFNLRADLGITEVYSFAADAAGNIWGDTRKALLLIKTDSLHFQTLSFDYGIGHPDFYAFRFAPNGELVIGGRNKIFLFNPKTIQRNPERPKPYIAEIQVQGKPLPAIPFVNGAPGLRLRASENFFSLAFSAIAYTLGDKCRFRFRLLGFEDWQEAGTRRHATYTNVPGGDYLFQLQVANNEGVWSDAVLEMPVWVATAWWATWWFRIPAALAVLVLGYGAYRYRVLQIRREERLKSVFEKRLANVEMSALLAQMNPHFLFNSLNSIDSYIIRNESRKASEYLNNFARLIRLILNNSRTNYISLKDELESLDLYLQMESLRFKDKFEYEIQTDTRLDPTAISIPPMLIQPYIENAIWHGLMHKDTGVGKVAITVQQQGDNLVCTVEDNGVGRARARELSDRRGAKQRQSMGMKITEDRIELINKLYDANTRVQIIDLYDDTGTPAGTRIILTIPI